MADRSKIEWTDATWNPIRARNRVTGKLGWHCEHASPGCAHCYSETFNRDRLGTRLPFKPGHLADVEIILDEAMLLQPLRWRGPRKIFVCSMTDLFGEWVPDEMIDRVFAVVALSPQHTFQVLTKRSARMRAYMAAHRAREIMGEIAAIHGSLTIDQRDCPEWPLPNVWLGVSAEDQRRADERVPDLLATPAAVRFVSAEPLIEAIDFTRLQVVYGGQVNALSGLWASCPLFEKGGRPMIQTRLPSTCVDLIIVGGESGRDARPLHPQWVRDIRDPCAAAGVAFFFKQWGTFVPVGHVDRGTATDPNEFAWERVGKARAGRLLDGVEHNGMPGVRP